ncbi:MAG: amino acid ABC transporter substrate-binding protein [Rhodospirillales bacterium]|nr:amino acid ABC transporter substrate-binding protein [Rhodospirillales bacterium]
MLARFSRALLVAAGLAGLGGTAMAQSAPPVKIGFSIAKTGLFAAAAPSQLTAYELWRDQVNAKGGLDVGGTKRRIEFVQYDDQSDPSQAVRIYEKLANDDKVDLLLAPWGTPHHFALAGVLERLKFPMVGNSAASSQLRDIKPGYIWFPTSAIPDRMATELATMMKGQGVKTAAVTGVQLPFSIEIRKFLMPALEKAGIKVVVSQEYPPDAKDLTAVLTQVRNAKPDAILSLSYPNDSVGFMTQAKELGVSAPFQFVLVGPTIDFFPKMFGPAADGLITIGHWSPHQKAWPRAKPFFDAYVAKFNARPDYLDTALAYMSCEILEQAVAKSGLDREKLRAAIAGGTFDTINGPVKFDGVQNAITPTAFLQIQKGEFHLVWPKTVATSDFQPRK